MHNTLRYVKGAVFGICAEYLYRVEFNIYPLIIMMCIFSFWLIDTNLNKNKKI